MIMCFTAILESIAETCLQGVVIVKNKEGKNGKLKGTGRALSEIEATARARGKAGNKGNKD